MKFSNKEYKDLAGRVKDYAKSNNINLKQAKKEMKIANWQYSYSLKLNKSPKNKARKTRTENTVNMTTMVLPDTIENKTDKMFLLIGSYEEINRTLRNLGNF